MTTYGLKTGRSADQTLSGKVSHSLAAAENDVLVGAPSPFGTWVKKTLTEFKTILGITENAVGWSRTGGTTPKTLTVNETITLPTVTAGGIPYGSAANVLADLAKGNANLKMYMNAGATAPEWAQGLKIGTFTRDLAAASGDVGYTGVGFKPAIVIFLASEASVVGATSWGFSNGTVHYYMQADFTVAGAFAISAAFCIFIQEDATNFQRAFIKSMDADGFTLTWEKGATPTGTISVVYLAIR